MKTKFLTFFLILFISNIYSQKAEKAVKWRPTEMDTLTVAQDMFDDLNFVMAYPFLNHLLTNHPEDYRLKYMVGICSLVRPEEYAHGLELLLDVYKNNKSAEDIEYYVALAYHYNDKFEEAIDVVDVYLKKKLTKPQIRGAEKLKEYCKAKNKIVPLPDEGKLEDYINTSAGK
ncbi:hypothetical protein BH10BAC1_BH10BAC1_17880 [soil metagenome]